MTFLLIVFVFFLLAAAQALLLALFGLRGFSYARSFSRPAAYEGEPVELIEVIRNRSPFFLPWVRVETSLPASFAFSTREEVEIRGMHYHVSVFTLMPFCQVTRRHHVTLTRRGHYRLEGASLTAGDLFGMNPLMREISAPAEILVWPKLLPDIREQLPSFRSQGEVSVRRWIQPDPFLVNGIRGYRDGDPERDIHWAATARLGALQVRTHDYTADPRLMVLINGQKTESQWGGLMDYEQEQIEYAISLAASLCVDALRRGQEAGFAASMPKLEVLIIAMTDVSDLSPLKNCMNLEYLELNSSPKIHDLSPLEGHTALRHLNIAGCPLIKDISALYGLKDLERLWIGSETPIPAAQVTKMRASAPGCRIDTTTADPHGNAWRFTDYDPEIPKYYWVPRYEKLRDQLGYNYQEYSFYWLDPLCEREAPAEYRGMFGKAVYGLD